MKNLLICFIAFLGFNANAQTEVDFLNAIGKKDFSNIQSYMASEISFCINDNQKKIKRSKAVSEIESFLSDKTVQKFKILHNGKASDKSSSYRVARMKTQSGTYRIFAYSETVGGSAKVVEVRIDPM